MLLSSKMEQKVSFLKTLLTLESQLSASPAMVSFVVLSRINSTNCPGKESLRTEMFNESLENISRPFCANVQKGARQSRQVNSFFIKQGY